MSSFWGLTREAQLSKSVFQAQICRWYRDHDNLRSWQLPSFPVNTSLYENSPLLLSAALLLVLCRLKQTSVLAQTPPPCHPQPSNTFNIDSNTWYQITNDRYNASKYSLRVGGSSVALYTYLTNLTSPQQRWQIFPVADGGGWNFRAEITGSAAYMSQCEQLSSNTASTSTPIGETDLCMALGASTNVQRRWTLSQNSDGTFDIQPNNTNHAGYQEYYVIDNATNVVAFTKNSSAKGTKWSFSSIAAIDNAAFSSGFASASASATSSTSSSTATSTPTPSTQSSSSGLSTGASAGIGVGVGIVALAIIGGLLFWFMRRRKRRSNTTHDSTAKGVDHAHASSAGRENKAPYQDEAPAVNVSQPAELHQDTLHELGESGRRAPVAELG